MATAENTATGGAMTGDGRVDAVLARLPELDAMAPVDQLAAFAAIHDALAAVLDDTDG